MKGGPCRLSGGRAVVARGQDGGPAQPVPQGHDRARGPPCRRRPGRVAERRVADQQMVDDLPGHHQPVAAVGVGGIGRPPAAVVGHPALHVPVVAQGRLELDDPGLAARIGVLDGVGEDLHQGQVQRVGVVGGGIEPAQPPREGVPRRSQAGPFARQFQAQGRDRIGEPLGGQRGDVVGAAGARQQLHGPLAHSFAAAGSAAAPGPGRRLLRRPPRRRPRRARPCPRRWSGPAVRRGRRCTAGPARPGRARWSPGPAASRCPAVLCRCPRGTWPPRRC